MPEPLRIAQLTNSEEKFCREFAMSQNGMVAYAKAFPAYRDPRIQRQGAADLLKQPRISSRVAELQESLSNTYNFTFEEHMMELQKIRDGAMGANQFKTALDAEVMRGKLVGFHKGIDDPKPNEVHNHLHVENAPEASDDARASAIIKLLRDKVGS